MALPKAPEGFEWEEVSELSQVPGVAPLPQAPEGYAWEEQPVNSPSGKDIPNRGYAEDTVLDLAESMGDAATFGLMRVPQSAAVAAAMGMMPQGEGKSFPERYNEAGKFVENRKEAMRSRSPVASIAGGLLGGFSTGRVLPAANIGPASTLAKYGANIGVGSLYGGALSLVDEGTKQFTTGEYNPKAMGERIGTGAGTGATLSALIGPAAYAVQKAMPNTQSLRTAAGKVADAATARGAAIAKNIFRGKGEALGNISEMVGNRGTMAAQPGSGVTRIVESVGPTPAGAKLENTVLAQASRANGAALEQQIPSLSGKISTVTNPSAKVQKANDLLKERYADLATTLNNAEDNFRTGSPTFGFSFDDISQSLGKNASSIVNAEAVKVLKTNPTFIAAIDDEGFISPRMMEAVIESMSKARQAGSSYHKATEITKGLQDMLENRFNGYAKMISDYRKIHEYEEGLKTFSRYLTPEASAATKQSLPPTGRIGFNDAEIAARVASVQPTSSAPEKKGLLRSLGNVLGASSYSAPAASGTAIREATRAAGHQYDKKSSEDLARYLNLTPQGAMDYLNTYGVHRPGTYVPALQNIYNLYNARQEPK